MNAAQHLAIAEQLLATSADDATEGLIDTESTVLLRAQVHVLCAIGREMGIPGAAAGPAGDNDA